MRLVLDTDVLVAAVRSSAGASRVLLRAVLERRAGVLLSTALVVEYETVLTRADTLDAAGISAEEARSLLDELCAVCVPVGFHVRWRPAAADPDDDLVLETAVNGVADAIASFNHRDLAAAAARFGIPVVRPALLLPRIPP